MAPFHTRSRPHGHSCHPRARQHAQHCDHPAHAPVTPARASRHTRHPREGGDPVTPVCPHRTVGITGSRLALAVARLAGTSGVCFRARSHTGRPRARQHAQHCDHPAHAPVTPARASRHTRHPREGGDPVTPVCPHRTVGITGSRLALAVARLAGMTSGVCFRDRSHTGHPRARQHAQHCDHPAHAPVIPARASRHTRHPREGGDPVTPVCPHRTVGITGSRLALAVARLAGMTSGVCFRSRYPFPLNAPLIGFQKRPFGVLGQHSKTWSDLKSACLPPTPRPAAE